MRQHLRSWSRALGAATLVGALGAAGCGDTTTVTDLAPSDFPGSSIADAFLSDDGVAFTNTNVDASAPRVFRNVANDDAIIVFLGRHDDGNYSTGLFASYFDGTRFTPPVSILGADEDATSARGSINVLFLETSSYQGTSSAATSAGRGRDGDAILIYTSSDTDDVASAAAVDRDANTRVYATYFDRSKATAAAVGSVQHGFERVSTPIDFDHVLMAAGNDPSVGAAMFASDSLHGTHNSNNGFGVLSGDPTSFVSIVFRKAPSAGTTPVADRWFAVPFDLGQTGNAIAAQAGPTTGLLNPGVGIFDDGDLTGASAVVNDGTVLWTASTVDTNSQDTVLTASVISASGVTAINVGTDPTPNADSAFLPVAANVYGPDHGLDSLYVLFVESGYSDVTNGSRHPDGDLMIAQIDAGASSRTVVEADAFRGTVDATNPDLDAAVLRSAVSTQGAVGAISSVITKDSGAIVIQIAQSTTDVGDVNDNSNTLGAPAFNQTQYIQVVQTGRPAASLGTSILAAPLKVTAIDSTGDAITANTRTQRPVQAFDFQLGLPNGAAATDGGANDVSDAWQSNPNKVFFTYTQRNDVGAAGNVPNENRLYTAGIEITPDAGTAAPTVTALRPTTQAVVTLANASAGSGNDVTWGVFNAQVIDRGIPGGDVLTFFFSNDNHVSDSTVVGSYAARRLYVWDGSTTSLVSSNGTADRQTVGGTFSLALVASRVHVHFQEYAATSTSEFVVGTRSFAANAATLAAIPALGDAPAFIDLPQTGAINSVEVHWSTSTVATYVNENGHTYYNETRSDAAHYRTAGGLPDPTLIDNDGWHQSQNITRVFINDDANELRDSFYFYTKQDPYYNDDRGFIRVHD